jgi:RNA polymerase sigma-70 factor, ECF subfamily
MNEALPATAMSQPPRGDDSAALLVALRSDGAERDEAIAQLHALLLRATRFEVRRRQGGRDLDDLAMQAADDALVAVLAKLDTFRGDSRFTTWAYKFGLLEASVRCRRRAWQDREVQLEPDRWPLFPTTGSSPAEDAERGELLDVIQRLIADALTPHQRSVLVALAIDGVPIDVLSERLNTTRGALYKTLHDARRKLRAALAEAGHPLGEV